MNINPRSEVVFILGKTTDIRRRVKPTPPLVLPPVKRMSFVVASLFGRVNP